MNSREFTNGWNAAAKDKLTGEGKRYDFPEYRSDEFKMGYNSYWDKIGDDLYIPQ